jgi:hypothetical protein
MHKSTSHTRASHAIIGAVTAFAAACEPSMAGDSNGAATEVKALPIATAECPPSGDFGALELSVAADVFGRQLTNVISQEIAAVNADGLASDDAAQREAAMDGFIDVAENDRAALGPLVDWLYEEAREGGKAKESSMLAIAQQLGRDTVLEAEAEGPWGSADFCERNFDFSGGINECERALSAWLESCAVLETAESPHPTGLAEVSLLGVACYSDPERDLFNSCLLTISVGAGTGSSAEPAQDYLTIVESTPVLQDAADAGTFPRFAIVDFDHVAFEKGERSAKLREKDVRALAHELGHLSAERADKASMFWTTEVEDFLLF